MALTRVSRSLIDGVVADDPILQEELDLKAPLESPTFTGTVSGVTKAMVGLGSVDNTADSAKPISAPQQAALDLKAPLASPTFTGTPAGPTASAGTNTTQFATTAFVRTEVANLVASAPAALDTLDELAAALGDDANFAATVTTALAGKAPLASPTFTGTVSGITKSMVGLSNVDNTSNATERAAVRTLSNASLQDSTTFIIDETDATKKVQLAAELVSTASTVVLTAPSKSGVLLTDPRAVTEIAATLDLNFTNINGAPFAGNLTRATVGGLRQKRNGLLVATVANEPGIDFSAGTALGTGFYGAFTNLLLRSEEFDNASWTKNNTTISSNSTAAPDGNTTADTLTDTNAAGDAYCRQSVAVANDGATYTASVFLKQGTTTTSRLTLTLSGGSTVTENALITWATGVVSGANASVEDVGNGWKRLSVKITNNTSGNTSLLVDIRASGDGSGVETGTVYAWGTQLTATAFPVPYVPTSSATVTRNADSMIISGTDFTEFFNPVEGTFLLEAYTPRIGSVAYPWSFAVDDGTGANRLGIYISQANGTSEFLVKVSSATAGQCFVPSTLISDQLFRAAASYKANEFRLSMNGATAIADTSGALPSGLNRLLVGSGDNIFNSHIRRLIYWPKALTATELQRMTA